MNFVLNVTHSCKARGNNFAIRLKALNILSWSFINLISNIHFILAVWITNLKIFFKPVLRKNRLKRCYICFKNYWYFYVYLSFLPCFSTSPSIRRSVAVVCMYVFTLLFSLPLFFFPFFFLPLNTFIVSIWNGHIHLSLFKHVFIGCSSMYLLFMG